MAPDLLYLALAGDAGHLALRRHRRVPRRAVVVHGALEAAAAGGQAVGVRVRAAHVMRALGVGREGGGGDRRRGGGASLKMDIKSNVERMEKAEFLAYLAASGRVRSHL